MTAEIAGRLAASHIQLVAGAKSHFLFTRETCIALVERKGDGFGSIGSTGLMTDAGLAYLVWRDGRALLVGKAGETAAGPAQVEAIRKFSDDLQSALHADATARG